MYSQLIYTSMLTGPVARRSEVIKQISASSQHRNRERQVTGCMVVVNDRIIQFLEGTREAVGSLYAKLQADERHEDLQILMELVAGERVFPNWNMEVYRADAGTPGSEEFHRLLDAVIGSFRFDFEEFLSFVQRFVEQDVGAIRLSEPGE